MSRFKKSRYYYSVDNSIYFANDNTIKVEQNRYKKAASLKIRLFIKLGRANRVARTSELQMRDNEPSL